MPAVVTFTMNPAIDVAAEIDVVVADRKLRCSGERREPGGGGINVARAAHRLGADVVALYTAGGATGAMLQRLLDEDGVPNRAIAIADDTRENFFVRETTTSRHFRFGMPGPRVAKDEVARCRDALLAVTPPPAFAVLSGSLPRDVPDTCYAELAAALRARGIKVVVDTSDAALAAAARSGVFLIKPNQRELELLSGVHTQVHGLEAAARRIVEDGCAEVVLVSMGRGGALLVTKDDVVELNAPPVTLVSKIGAGDSTVAGLVTKLAAGWSLVEAARYGVAAGSAAVMTPGSELCRRDDVERLYAEMTARARGRPE